MSDQQPSKDAVAGYVRDLFLHHGLRPVVVFLNGLSAFRFSAVTCFDRGMLKTVCYYDREDPRPDALPAVPEEASYCQFVKARRDIFAVPDAVAEPCLQGHPARTDVRAYCGAPLYGADGTVLGTICHFNIDPLPVLATDRALLHLAAQVLMEHNALDACRPR